jgi:hypothetical protein
MLQSITFKKERAKNLQTLQDQTKVTKAALLQTVGASSSPVTAIKAAEISYIRSILDYHDAAILRTKAEMAISAILQQELGGRPTTYYHSMAEPPRSPTTILSIHAPDAPSDADPSEAESLTTS